MTLLIVNAAATWAMVGLIWFVQVVHYPLFEGVGESGFCQYEERHRVRTTWVVAPPMLAEAITAALLVWFRQPGVDAWMAWVGLALVAIAWLSTAVLQVPQHEALRRGFLASSHRKLVVTNWLRTFAWTARGVLAAVMIAAAH